MFPPQPTEGTRPSSSNSAPPPSAPLLPGTLERLLAAVARHVPETPGESSPEQLLRRSVAYIEAARGSPAGLELGFTAAATLADLRLDPDALAATLLVAAARPEALAGPELAAALGEEVQTLAEGASRLGSVHWDRL